MDFENYSKILKANISLKTKFQGNSRKQEMEFLVVKINHGQNKLGLAITIPT